MIRRIVALALVIGLVVGLVSVVRAVLGDDTSTSAVSDGAGGTDPATGSDVGTASTLPVGDPAATQVAADGTTTTAAPGTVADTASGTSAGSDPNRVPTPADPARVLLVGDSEAGGLSPFLEDVLRYTGVAAMSLDYKVSSGLVRPDFFDWPAHLRETVPAVNPDIVVALFGGNDGQGFLGSDTAAGAAAGKAVDTPEWRAEYGERVGEVMDYLSAEGRTLVWVGVPNAEKESLTAALAVQNEVVKAEVAKHPDVIFVDSWNKFTGIDGGFAPYVLDPRDGEYKAVRSETDGFHLNTEGEQILAYYVGTAVIDELRARGAAI